MFRVTAAALSLAAYCALSAAATADDKTYSAGPLPTPPCAGAPSPGYAGIGDTPDVHIWRDNEMKGWQVPACTGFPRLETNTLMTASGRFKAAGGMNEIADRLARISTLMTVRYYAGADESWKNLYSEAHALTDVTSNDTAMSRPDFTSNDIETGRTLRYWQEENSLLSGIVYRMTIIERTDTKLVYSIVNESSAKAMFVTAIEPGDFRQFYTIEREDGDVWHYYSMVEAHIGAGPFGPSSKSFQSRAIAYYRHIAGYPTQTAADGNFVVSR